MMKLPFGLILTTASSLAISAATAVAAQAVDEAVTALHARYGDDLKAISLGLVTDTAKTGAEKAEIVIAALVSAALKDGVAVVYDLAKAVAQRVYLDVKADVAVIAAGITAKLKALAA